MKQKRDHFLQKVTISYLCSPLTDLQHLDMFPAAFVILLLLSYWPRLLRLQLLIPINEDHQFATQFIRVENGMLLCFYANHKTSNKSSYLLSSYLRSGFCFGQLVQRKVTSLTTFSTYVMIDYHVRKPCIKMKSPLPRPHFMWAHFKNLNKHANTLHRRKASVTQYIPVR